MIPSSEGAFTVTAKIATTLDGRIALGTGESQWITGQVARNLGHRLRARHDIILTGSGTVIADDPLLTARPDGQTLLAQPVRLVIDRRGRLNGKERILTSAGPQCPVILVTGNLAFRHGREGLTVLRQQAGEMLSTVLSTIARSTAERRKLPCARIYCEGGAGMLTSLLQYGLIDRLEWFRAPVILGDDGHAAFGPLRLDDLGSAVKWRRRSVRALDSDLWERYERQEETCSQV
jgi:diaminohydroxyphosphoribosylaminopyrimidine deaminase / 5-amino-6-(5-phosphoribosylamino)uracil reductase